MGDFIMASLIPAGNVAGTGSMTLSAPATNSNQTATLPDATGTVMVSGNIPAFSALLVTNQTVSNNVWTKVTLGGEEFDTNNNFASSRFTPTVAGYYQINAAFSTTTSTGNIFVALYKNGANYKQGNLLTTTPGVGGICVVSSLVYCNGSTDYIEMYVLSSLSTPTNTGANTVYMNGCMLRGA